MKKTFIIISTFIIFMNNGTSQNISNFKEGILEVYTGPVKFSKNNKIYFNKGLNVGIGLNAYTSKYISFRFDINYSRIYLNKNKYQNNDTLNTDAYSLKESPLCFLSLTQSLKIIPWSNSKIAPYFIGGISEIQGISDGKTEVHNADVPTITNRFPAGFRILAEIGLGAQYSLSDGINLLIEVKQFLEILENNTPKNLFYNYKQPNLRYNFAILSLGVSYKLKEKRKN